MIASVDIKKHNRNYLLTKNRFNIAFLCEFTISRPSCAHGECTGEYERETNGGNPSQMDEFLFQYHLSFSPTVD